MDAVIRLACLRSRKWDRVLLLAAVVLCWGHVAAAAAPRQFDVTRFGATGDGKALETTALQQAIDACAEAGGGEVVFPPGTYRTGSIELRSKVHLVLKPDAVLLGSDLLKDYSNRKLIYADGADDIGIHGGGIIDGQGDAFWEERTEKYRGPSWGGTAQFNYRALKRPSFIQFRRCRNVVLRDLTLRNSPSWTVHLLRCERALVERVKIRNPLYGPNTDGIDINSSIDVVVRHCDIITGDDGVVLKSTEPGHDHPSRNITVENCRIWSACNCLKLGTETHDRFENIQFRNCHLYADSDVSLDRPISGVAIESVDGAQLTNITVSDLTMNKVRAPIFVRLGHRGGNSTRTRQVEPRVPGRIENVVIRNIQAENSLFESSITGIPGHPVQNISLENIRIEYEGGGKEDWLLGVVPDEAVIKRYPEAWMFGRLPAYGLYCRHVDGLRINGFAAKCLSPDPRPLLVCDDVQRLDLRQVNAAAAVSLWPVMWLINTRDVAVQECTAPPGTSVFMAIERKDKTQDDIRWKKNNTAHAQTAVAKLRPGQLVDLSLPLFGESSPGLIVIDAAAMRLLDPMKKQTDDRDPQQAYIAVPVDHSWNRGSALGRFTVTKAGQYKIWVRAYGASGEANSFFTAIDRGPLALSDVTRVGSWYWLTVHDREERAAGGSGQRTYDLSVGEHILHIQNRESGTKIDTIVLVRADVKFDPTKRQPR